MNLPLYLCTLILFIHSISSQRSYDEAECNGNQIYSFQKLQDSGKVDIIFNPTDDTPLISEFQFNIINPPLGATSDIPSFESTAIDPTTGIIYTIITVPGTSGTYLATVDIGGDINIINAITPTTDIITGMTFDCNGNLYVIKKEPIGFLEFGVFQMDTVTAEHVLYDTFIGNCNPLFGDCDEMIGYNWDDGLLYRLSSDFSDGIKLYRINEDGTKIDVTVSDPNGYCLGAGSVFAMEYIGEDLWLISCDSGFGATRLLDTSDITNPIIGPIGTDGIEFVSTIDRSAAGLIGTSEGNEFCVAICPTTIPTTSIPTTAPTTTTTACIECPFVVVLDEISPLLLSNDCPTPVPTPIPTPVTTPKTKWYRESDSSDSSSDRRRRRMFDLYTSSSDSDDSDITDICLINGDSLIFVDTLCEEDGWDDSYSDSSDSDDDIVLTDDFLAPICVMYSIEDLVDSSDCGDINSIFLGLCTSSDTDFDVSLLGTGDVDNILDTAAHDNILSAIGYRNDDGELGVQIIVQDPALSFTLCFVNVGVTETFNDTRYDLDVAQNGAIIYTDNAGDVITCTILGLPCLNFFFGCDTETLASETGAENAFINNNEALYSNPLKVLDELDPYIKWTLICIMIIFVVSMFVSIYICFVDRNEKRRKEEDELDDVLKAIEERKNRNTVIMYNYQRRKETQYNDTNVVP